jgi:hypothetical protein
MRHLPPATPALHQSTNPLRSARAPQQPSALALAALFVLASLAMLIWQRIRETPPSPSQAITRRQLEALVLDSGAPRNIFGFTIDFGPAEEPCALFALNALKTRDNPFWKPYAFLQTNAPAFLRKRLPLWREPRKVRLAAALWLANDDPDLTVRAAVVNTLTNIGAFSGGSFSRLCRDARNDPNPAVRQPALWTLGRLPLFSEDSLRIMLSALNYPGPADRRAALRWFGRNKAAPEQVVPLLLHGLEDDAMRSDYATVLRAYGPRARFAVEPLLALAQTNNPATASVAIWALAAVDYDAAQQAGVSWWEPPRR